MAATKPEDVYGEYVVAHGLERVALLELLAARVGDAATVLYPGCSVHVTPSFFFRHVVYVDRSDLARAFFADVEGVQQLIGARRRRRQRPFVRFVAQDFTTLLPVRDRSVDLLLALFAGGVSRACARYVAEGGLVVSNDHQGDALEASACADLSLVAVISERRGAVQYVDRDLDGYLRPRAAAGRRHPAGAPEERYERRAEYYVFRKGGGRCSPR